jgi:hypothetical protein
MRLAAGAPREELQGMKATRFHGVNVRPTRLAAIGTKPHASHS